MRRLEQAIGDACLTKGELQDALLVLGVGLEVLCLEDLTPCARASSLGHAVAARVLGNGHRLLQTPLDFTATLLGKRYGFRGGRLVNCSACAAGAQAIGEAWQMIRGGAAATVALAGATDSMLNPLGFGGFSLLRVLVGRE